MDETPKQPQFRLDLWQQQAESMRRALEDTGQGITQIINAAGFDQLEARWDGRDQSDRQVANPMHLAQPAGTHPSAPGGPPVTDDLVSRILAAIEETERAAYGSGTLGWATYLHADGGMGYTSPVSGKGDLWFTAGEQTEPDSVRVVFDEKAALRRCAADRKLVELHRQSAELMWLCELCGGEGQNIDCTYPCDTLRLLAEGYGITQEVQA